MSDLAEVARSAAEIMSRKGHCKGVLQDGEGKVCFQGALMLALTGRESIYNEMDEWNRLGSPWNPEISWSSWSPWGDIAPEDRYKLEAVSYAATRILGGRGQFLSPVHYNNSGETTQEDVILLLKETAEALESVWESVC